MGEVTWRRNLIAPDRLREIRGRSNALGLTRLASHLSALVLTGHLVWLSVATPWAFPFLALHGVVLIFLFAPLHESTHRTAFRSRWINQAVAWVCGAVLVLPPLYFRHFHFTHHRWTQDPGRDPELVTPKPATLGAYLWLVAGVPFWRERIVTTLGHALGRFEPLGFLPGSAKARIVCEARTLWAIYALIAAASIAAQSWAAVAFWIVPALLGQPALRLFLMAEHTGRPLVSDMLVNGRTTLSNPAFRWLTWNMPYHIEHHAFPSAPFHALPELHAEIRPRLGEVAAGYIAVNAKIVHSLASGRRFL